MKLLAFLKEQHEARDLAQRDALHEPRLEHLRQKDTFFVK